MSKEAARVSKLIKQNNQSTFITKVELSSTGEVKQCIQKIAKNCPDCLVMISSATKDNRLVSAVYIPEQTKCENFLSRVVDSTGISSDNVFTDLEQSQIVEISYPSESEQYAFKNVDVLNGSAFSLLKREGLYQEESSEEEYGTDF